MQRRAPAELLIIRYVVPILVVLIAWDLSSLGTRNALNEAQSVPDTNTDALNACSKFNITKEMIENCQFIDIFAPHLSPSVQACLRQIQTLAPSEHISVYVYGERQVPVRKLNTKNVHYHNWAQNGASSAKSIAARCRYEEGLATLKQKVGRVKQHRHVFFARHNPADDCPKTRINRTCRFNSGR